MCAKYEFSFAIYILIYINVVIEWCQKVNSTWRQNNKTQKTQKLDTLWEK